MDIIVRPMQAADRPVWAQMRAALWPEDGPAEHAKEIDAMLAAADMWGFVADAAEGGAAGFAEVAIRKYANGCDSAPVAFLEGIWVKPQLRRRGIGAQLIAHVQSFVAARGFRELGSDTWIDNRAAQAAHLAWGFSETERVVYFRKLLEPPAGRAS